MSPYLWRFLYVWKSKMKADKIYDSVPDQNKIQVANRMLFVVDEFKNQKNKQTDDNTVNEYRTAEKNKINNRFGRS